MNGGKKFLVAFSGDKILFAFKVNIIVNRDRYNLGPIVYSRTLDDNQVVSDEWSGDYLLTEDESLARSFALLANGNTNISM